MDKVEQAIRETIENDELLQPQDKVLVAVSGGPDSMMLLHWLWKHRTVLEIDVHVAHVHHQLRGQDADLDQKAVQTLCQKLKVPFHTQKVDVQRYAQNEGMSKQTAARELRYAYLQDVAYSHGLNKIAVAHHGDDQLETVLMRIIRGAGLGGLSGMPVKREERGMTIIRPLLSLSKKDIEAYCTKHDLQPRLDSTNLEEHDTRNRIRHRLLPAIHEQNPNVSKTMYDMTQVLRQEDAYLQQVAADYVHQLTVEQNEDTYVLDIRRWAYIPFALQRRVILLILNYLHPHYTGWEKVHIDAVLHMIHKTEGYKKTDLPQGIVASRTYDRLYVQMNTHLDATPTPEAIEIEKEGLYTWGTWTFTVQCISRADWEYNGREVLMAFRTPEDGRSVHVALFDRCRLQLPLRVRSRKKGDKLSVPGMKGRKKVKDIFINEKLPQPQRALWPVVTDQSDVLWVPSFQRSAKAMITEKTESIWKMTAKREG